MDKDNKLNFEEYNFMISPISKINSTENKNNNIRANSNNEINFLILKIKIIWINHQ